MPLLIVFIMTLCGKLGTLNEPFSSENILCNEIKEIPLQYKNLKQRY